MRILIINCTSSCVYCKDICYDVDYVDNSKKEIKSLCKGYHTPDYITSLRIKEVG